MKKHERRKPNRERRRLELTLAEDVRVALEKRRDITGQPMSLVVDWAVRKYFGLPDPEVE